MKTDPYDLRGGHSKERTWARMKSAAPSTTSRSAAISGEMFRTG